MHASAVVSEAAVRALFVLFLILRCAEDREAFQGYQPFVCYIRIAGCALEVATIIKLQSFKPSTYFQYSFQNGIDIEEPYSYKSRTTLDIHHAFSSIQHFFIAFFFSQLVASALDSPASHIGRFVKEVTLHLERGRRGSISQPLRAIPRLYLQHVDTGRAG